MSTDTRHIHGQRAISGDDGSYLATTGRIPGYASYLVTMIHNLAAMAGDRLWRTKKGDVPKHVPEVKPKELLGGDSGSRRGLGGVDLRLRPANHA
ncbi:MAG: hypothetical protein ACREMY_09910, partial [bacterium]